MLHSDQGVVRRPRRLIAALVLATLALLAAAPVAAAARREPTATTFGGIPTAGALFITAVLPLHICSASVVRSANRSVIVTAAHCIRGGTGKGYEFAPGFHDGKAPYGMWRVTAAYAAPGWIRHFDTHDDFAFLVVAPQRVNGRLRRLQDVTGGNALGRTPAPGRRVTVIGYPLGVGGSPIHCAAPVFRRGAFPGFHCNGFAAGTSGGPWLADHHGVRHLVGLVGGLHQGGCSAATSYSPPLGRAAHRVLRRAGHNRQPDRFPAPPGDGC
ncbi:MAG TPA: trypsin-like peptidase domain-containing protein [Mycobacteriales bacterium]|nr:trypsin-like peptidase domain-containing protein [Mycobacteriales bacterium]